MKKSQSVFLLSGLVPLVVAPIAIVASCSSDTTTSTTPTDSKYTVGFNANKSFAFGDSTKPSNDSTFNAQWVKSKVIEKKAEIFNASSGTLPTDDAFWQSNVTVENLAPANQTLKFNLKLTNASTVDGATDQQKTISAEITFTGFKADGGTATPSESKYSIDFVSTKSFAFGDSTKPSSDSTFNEQWIKSKVIEKKAEIFTATSGTLPTDDAFWQSNVAVESLTRENQTLKFTLKLTKASTVDGATAQQQTISAEITFTGFKADAPLASETTVNPTLSTVTLGLNGDKTEIESEVNRAWILSNVNLIFAKGADLIKAETDIVDQSISWEEITGGTAQQARTSKKLKFQVSAGKWYGSDGNPGQANQEFSFTITGISSTPTANQPLRSKSGANVNVDLLDPQNLGKLTYADVKADVINLLDNNFVFKFRKNLLTGDFSKINSAADLVKNNQVTRTFDDQAKAITIAFTISKDKLNPVQQADVSITIKIQGFK